MRGATVGPGHRQRDFLISIHAPRAGRDEQLSAPENAKNDFNPRAPCGARHGQASPDMFGIKFQSTRPVRGATPTSSKSSKTNSTFQSTRPVRGATVVHHALVPAVFISIHAPRAGRDADAGQTLSVLYTFQSTRPVRGATRCTMRRETYQHDFNPRAPCGARPSTSRCCAWHSYFNPRAPCGARPMSAACRLPPQRFQSTRPVRGATSEYCMASRFGCNFNPRAPCGARRRRPP